MIIKQPDILVKLGLITQYDNITGGQDSGPLSKTTCRDVGLVNNSRLTECQPSQHIYIPTEGAKVTRPFVNCSMDLITDLPPVEGYDSILVVDNQGLSKGVILTPCNKTLTSKDMA